MITGPVPVSPHDTPKPRRSHQSARALSKLQAPECPVAASLEFKSLATTLLRALAADTRYPYRLVSALRRSSRDSIWPSLAPMSTSAAAAFHPLVKSARRSLGEKCDLDKLGEKARKPSSWWQISYNAACGYASESDYTDAVEKHRAEQEVARVATEAARVATEAAEKAAREAAQSATEAAEKAAREAAQRAEEAAQRAEEARQRAEKPLEFLEQTLVRRGVHQLSADWVKKDPDLTSLRGTARFNTFLAQLRSGD